MSAIFFFFSKWWSTIKCVFLSLDRSDGVESTALLSRNYIITGGTITIVNCINLRELLIIKPVHSENKMNDLHNNYCDPPNKGWPSFTLGMENLTRSFLMNGRSLVWASLWRVVLGSRGHVVWTKLKERSQGCRQIVPQSAMRLHLFKNSILVDIALALNINVKCRNGHFCRLYTEKDLYSSWRVWVICSMGVSVIDFLQLLMQLTANFGAALRNGCWRDN